MSGGVKVEQQTEDRTDALIKELAYWQEEVNQQDVERHQVVDE